MTRPPCASPRLPEGRVPHASWLCWVRLATLLVVGFPISAQRPLRVVLEAEVNGEGEDIAELLAAVPLPNGGLALTDGSDARIRLIDRNGAIAATIGRPGSGPMEFRRPDVLGLRGDSLWVFDRALQRLTVVSLSSRQGRSEVWPVSLRSLDGSTVVSSPNPVGFPVAGARMSAGIVQGGGAAAQVRAAYARHSDDGVLVLPLIDRPLSQRCSTTLPNGRRFLNPLCALPLSAVSPDGTRLVIAEPAWPGGPTGAVSLRAVAADGRQIWASTIRLPGLSIPAATRDSVVAARRSDASLAPYTAQMRAALDQTRFFPIARWLVVGGDHLVAFGAEFGGRNRWYLIDMQGRLRGSVDLGAGERMVGLTSDGYWSVRPDSDGFSDLRRYRIK